MEIVIHTIFQLAFNYLIHTFFVQENTLEKEDQLKDMVLELLKKRDLSDFELLDALFSDIKKELKNQQISNLIT